MCENVKSYKIFFLIPYNKRHIAKENKMSWDTEIKKWYVRFDKQERIIKICKYFIISHVTSNSLNFEEKNRIICNCKKIFNNARKIL